MNRTTDGEPTDRLKERHSIGCCQGNRTVHDESIDRLMKGQSTD
ncbi:hypothetical protein [Aliifodinibius sp. S!AR15-10]|nr:hypothetical protein [Aliifodinibius sp. S!AR15-10]